MSGRIDPEEDEKNRREKEDKEDSRSRRESQADNRSRKSSNMSQKSRKDSRNEDEQKSGQDNGKKCSQCGKKETTIHCVVTGTLVCKSCRGDNVRGVMGDIKESKNYLEVQYPKDVRERIGLIKKVQKDLEDKKRKALANAAEGFKQLRKQVDAREQQVLKEIDEHYSFKKNELDNEVNIYEGHLAENKAQNEKVSDNSCAMIHFPTGKMEDSQIASMCQTRKVYADIINGLHKPEEREEPQRSKLSAKFEKSEEKTFKAVKEYGDVKGDKEDEKDKEKKRKEKEKKEKEREKEREKEEEDEGNENENDKDQNDQSEKDRKKSDQKKK